jgi:ribosome recycling factor
MLIIVALLAATSAFIWLAYEMRGGIGHGRKELNENLAKSAEEDVEQIFNDEFREELRNRGRLHFENILNENAMFLQQDLRLTTSELNEYMKDEIKKVLKDEFQHYEESITSAKDQAIESIKKTQTAIEEQRDVLEASLKEQVQKEKAILISKFETHMGEIINHYIMEALAGELEVSDQLDFIFRHLEENKKVMIEDITGGA